MKIDNEGVFCDFCMVQFKEDRHGRLHSGEKKVKGFRGETLTALKYAVKCLFGTVICEDCDKAFSRKAAPAIPMNKKTRKYLRDVESAEVKPPWTKCVIRNKNGNNMCVPVTLNAAGKPISPGGKK
jgi:hypothetical protein